jgi:hypothetical protein
MNNTTFGVLEVALATLIAAVVYVGTASATPAVQTAPTAMASLSLTLVLSI